MLLVESGQVPADALLSWFALHRRELPWRDRPAGQRDPYRVWVSEVMLQQTQVATVIPYFLRWLERFPNIESLAQAPEEEVFSLWQGLGYYRRARYLHQGAQFILTMGEFPQSASSLRAVPGIGDYTAGAIASFAFGEAVPAIDGNVQRIVARLINSSAQTGLLTHEAREWVMSNQPQTDAGVFNEALMELGALVCRPRSPDCSSCPLASFCVARAHGTVMARPVRETKPQPKELRMQVHFVQAKNEVVVQRFPDDGWWAGLYGFPRVWTSEGELVGQIKHTVTNHRITFDVIHHQLEKLSDEHHRVPITNLAELAMPAPDRKALKMLQIPSLFSDS